MSCGLRPRLWRDLGHIPLLWLCAGPAFKLETILSEPNQFLQIPTLRCKSHKILSTVPPEVTQKCAQGLQNVSEIDANGRPKGRQKRFCFHVREKSVNPHWDRLLTWFREGLPCAETSIFGDFGIPETIKKYMKL